MLAPRKEATLTATQKALLRVEKLQMRGRFLAVNALLLLLAGYSALRFPHKFVRIQGDCDSNWLRADSSPEDPAIVCCNRAGGSDEPCYTGMDLLPVATSTQGAWVLPLTGVVFNYVGVMLGSDTTMDRIRACVRRALLYLGVMAFRTLVLYMALGSLERRVVGTVTWLFGAQQQCWFADLRRHGRCPQAFDHSDHVVLLVAHYVAIPLFEWCALSVEAAGKPGLGLKRTLLGVWLALVAGLAVYLLFFTTAFFHSPAENLVGLLVAQIGVMLPLYLLTQDQLAPNVSWLRLRHFVVLPGQGDKQH